MRSRGMRFACGARCVRGVHAYDERMHRFFRAVVVALLLMMSALPWFTVDRACAQLSRPSIGALNPADFGANRLLVVHYRRIDGALDDWNLWAWPEHKDGAAYAFEKSDAYGRIAIVPLRDDCARVGFIVRQGNWAQKDGDGDRFIDVSARAVTEVWLLGGDRAIYDRDAPIDLALKIFGAYLDDRDTILLASTAPLDAAMRESLAVRLRGEGEPVRVRSAQAITLAGAERAMTSVRLSRPLQDDEIARLTITMDHGMSFPVFARGVLESAGFQPLDAKLGAECSAKSTVFTTWSPVADKVELLLFASLASIKPDRTIALTRLPQGVWSTQVLGDLHGHAYQYRFQHYQREHVVADIHGAAATGDSSRSVVADLSRLEPAHWNETAVPRSARATDEVLYELHVRDFSVADASCPPALRGTYLGLIHEGRRSTGEGRQPAGEGRQPAGATTGLAHLRELGITAVHLMPVHDFSAASDAYNWGYWTALFNVPESNYCSDATDPLRAIVELRTAIERLHASNLRVMLDVVYNHTSTSGDSSPFEGTVPCFYFRTTPDGRMRNDAGCGNSIADERLMVRKYVIDSLLHWLRQYKVDGFRFDLLGTHTPATVRAICDRVRGERPDAMLYGEPWTGGGPTQFGKGAQRGMGIAVFNDALRNAIRGDLDSDKQGFAMGAPGFAPSIRAGVMGSIDEFAQEPSESINYVSAHDNLALTDKIEKAVPAATPALKRAMHKLALAVVLVSQGVPFLEGGSEICRTKGGDHNSYVAGDAVNRFDWEAKDACSEVFEYTRGLIAMRRAHAAFRISDDSTVRSSVHMLDAGELVAWTIDGRASGDSAREIVVALNGTHAAQMLQLPAGKWQVLANERAAGVDALSTQQGRVSIAPLSLFVGMR